ncbi:helix-turn-helix domain-containing protein [Maribacter sp. 2307UL18-2]|uniref:helix-turn-helix domain-containing protein n=1 Tax=Maribacter sp. 2307UL18-2 TaxID=3386274 RepID=UPI0039BCA260
MKSIALSSATIQGMFEQLHENFGGKLSINTKEHILELDNEFGKGRIRGITFKGDISFLEFDMVFAENFTLRTSTPEPAPICFAYCSRGHIMHSFGSQSQKRVLENFQTCILTNAAHEENVLYFSKDIQVKTALIIVKMTSKTSVEKKQSLNVELQESLLNGQPAKNSIYIGSYNLMIADKMQQLESIKQDGIVRSLLIEGLVHMILAHEIQQHKDDLKKQEKNLGSLTSREMKSVNEISQFIHNYPEIQHSIAELSRKSGLSPSKLQEGCKVLHGTTIGNYIRSVRVQKAADLIKNSDLNISEVVYSVGFTSRSYFSKIFRHRYHCSPKRYKEKQDMALSA